MESEVTANQCAEAMSENTKEQPSAEAEAKHQQAIQRRSESKAMLCRPVQNESEAALEPSCMERNGPHQRERDSEPVRESIQWQRLTGQKGRTLVVAVSHPADSPHPARKRLAGH